MATATKQTSPAKLGDIEFDCILKRETTYATDAPDYAMSEGAYNSATILRKPMEMKVTAFLTEMPLTWMERSKENYGGPRTLEEVIDQLLDIYFNGELVTFEVTSGASTGTYENMVITGISLPQESHANAIEAEIKLKQITLTDQQIVVVAEYVYCDTSAADAGTTSTSASSSSGTKKKWWQKVGDWFKNLFTGGFNISIGL